MVSMFGKAEEASAGEVEVRGGSGGGAGGLVGVWGVVEAWRIACDVAADMGIEVCHCRDRSVIERALRRGVDIGIRLDAEESYCRV